MTAFTKAVHDIFNCKDFLESCVINGCIYTCIQSKIPDEHRFLDTGLEEEVAFTLDFELPMYRKPKINDEVRFKCRTYKISRTEEDSATASLKLYLIDVSKGIG